MRTSSNRTGRTHLAVVALVLGMIAAACAGAAPSTPGATDRTTEAAPDTSFTMFDGRRASFADYRGTPLVVNFWASWCPSCIAEMGAAFRPAQLALGDRVAFLGMNLQDERSQASALVERTAVLFDLAEDPDGSLYLELGGLGMPFTVFIDADGNIVRRHDGALTEGQLVDLIEELLLP